MDQFRLTFFIERGASINIREEPRIPSPNASINIREREPGINIGEREGERETINGA